MIASVVTTVPVTSRARNWATRVTLGGRETGLDVPSWAICEQVRTISTDRLAARIGNVDAATMTAVSRVLQYLLNL